MNKDEKLPNKFSVDGSFVTFKFLESLLVDDKNKTISVFLEEHNMLGKEHYILSSVFLVNTLYGTFLNQKENTCTIFDETLKKYFKIKKNQKKSKKISKCIRNALAHYNIEYMNDGEIVFTDKDPKTEVVHFVAHISTFMLRNLLEELSKIL